jgi:hypothetical protein
MRKALQFILAAGVGGCAQVPQDTAGVETEAQTVSARAGASSPIASTIDELTFRGRITSITPSDTGNLNKRWVVSTKVEQVISGSFSQDHFAFSSHSPAQWGLEVGKEYLIRATRIAKGYRVDSAPSAIP